MRARCSARSSSDSSMMRCPSCAMVCALRWMRSSTVDASTTATASTVTATASAAASATARRLIGVIFACCSQDWMVRFFTPVAASI